MNYWLLALLMTKDHNPSSHHSRIRVWWANHGWVLCCTAAGLIVSLVVAMAIHRLRQR